MCHCDVQKYLSFTGSHKKFLILWAMLNNGWKCIFYYVSWFVSIILNFNAHYGAYSLTGLYSITQKFKYFTSYWKYFLEITF